MRGYHNIKNKKLRNYKISLAKKGKPLSEEHKRKISLAHIGKIPWDKGLKRPEISGILNPSKRPEVRKKISEHHKLNPPMGMLNKHHSEESKRKIGIANSKKLKGRHVSLKTEFTSERLKKMWNDEKYKENTIKSILKGLFKRPTSFEQKIIDLCKESNLPFKYVGNGQVIIGYKNPDFIETNGKKLLIETYAKWCHPQNYEEQRSKIFAKFGYKTLFLNEDDLYINNWEFHCLNKIKVFMSE